MAYLEQLAPILILLAVIAVVIARLPKVELGHTDAFRRRRVLNWLPLGLTYAFLYMARYNLTVSKLALGDLKDGAGNPFMSNTDFATIFGIGTLVYGFAFVINGPLTDRVGGRAAILASAGGAIVSNAAMGLVTWMVLKDPDSELAKGLTTAFSILYAGNMYFQ
ncbi:MAG: MFS transporter, partial [Myxococcales bacterium]|nr:MFS transporter [Myxococcales bacterium]